MDRNGYTVNSSIVIIIEGTGKRTAESFDGDPAGAPELFVTYSCEDSGGTGVCGLCSGGPEPGTPCDDGDPTTSQSAGDQITVALVFGRSVISLVLFVNVEASSDASP